MGDACIYNVGPYRGYHEYVQGLGLRVCKHQRAQLGSA